MTDPLPVLTEYETRSYRLTDRQARYLSETGIVTVTHSPTPGHWRITAKAHVGTLTVDGVRLLIRPKINLANLFLLLEVGLPESAWKDEVFDYATTADLLPSVIAFFARSLETTLARGVLRSYREHRERRVAPRGRIDHAAQFTRAGVAMPVACHYDDHTPDVAENRYLRAAARLALRVPQVPPNERRRLLRQLSVLEDVADLDIHPDDLDRIEITRLNAHYLPALRLAQLLLANLTLVDRHGGVTAASFVLDMNKLFERFVTSRLRHGLRGRLEVRAGQWVSLAHGRKVRMAPDLVFRRDGDPVYVGDIKYKLTDEARARNADYYQLLAYTTALDLLEGALIYCRTDGGHPGRTVTVCNTGAMLHTRALDLTGPPASVAEQLETLADWIADRATSRLLRQ